MYELRHDVLRKCGNNMSTKRYRGKSNSPSSSATARPAWSRSPDLSRPETLEPVLSTDAMTPTPPVYLSVCGSVCSSICTQSVHLSNCFPVCQCQLECLTYVLLEQGWTLSCAAVGSQKSVLVPPSSPPLHSVPRMSRGKKCKREKASLCPVVPALFFSSLKKKKTNGTMQ